MKKILMKKKIKICLIRLKITLCTKCLKNKINQSLWFRYTCISTCKWKKFRKYIGYDIHYVLNFSVIMELNKTNDI